MKDLTLVVMAAGMGSRYGGLKQLDPVGPNNEIILDYSVYDAKKAGFNKVVFIIREDIKDEFHKVIGANMAKHIAVDYACQRHEDIPAPFTVPEGRVKPWGTGQAVLAGKDVVTTPFAVINADDYYGPEAFDIIAKQLNEVTNDSYDYCMVGYQLANTLSDNGHVSRGRCDTKDGFLENIEELTQIQRIDGVIKYTADEGQNWVDLEEKTIVSMNMWGFTPTYFTELQNDFVQFLEARGTEMKSEFYVLDPLNRLIQNNDAKLRVLESSEKWFGVTYPEDKPDCVKEIQTMVDAGRYPAKIW